MTPEQQRVLAIANARLRLKNQSRGTNIAEQAGSGLNEGLAAFAGTPVDLMTSVINGLVPSAQFQDAGTTLQGGVKIAEQPAPPTVQNPVGGGSTFRALMEPFISDTAPQTRAQRYARRGGQEVGFGVPAALTGGALSATARANMPAYMATSLAGDAGSAVAGQTSREIAPNSDGADLVASILGGGGSALAASRMTPAYAPVPTRADIANRANAKWDAVKNAPEQLTDTATQQLRDGVNAALPTGQIAPPLYPKAFSTADNMKLLDKPKVSDVEALRRLIGNAVAGDPMESAVGMKMKGSVDQFLAGLKPADVTGGNAAGVVDDLTTARNLSARGHRYDAVDNKAMRAETRAATTGTGGNEVNAIKQNVRTLYDTERDPTLRGRRQGFTPAEMAQMERVVMGTGPQRLARLAGRMAPTSGALPMMATGLGGMAGAGVAAAGGPMVAAIPAIAGGVGFLGKAAAESMTKNEIQKLLDIIANGGPLRQTASRGAANAAVLQQLLTSSLSGPQ